jgi:mono/diheme cytochrome c family protein
MRYVFRPLPFPMNRLNAFLIAAPAALLLAALPSCKPADPIVIERKAPGDEPAAEAAGPQLPETISFNEHVQPILSENCYQCHGPDANTREPKDAPLRLDIAEHAMTPRENGKPVIIPGEPAASLLVKLMHSDKASEIMPPPESHKTMDADEIAILEKWIEQGAEYQDHWAFIPPTKADLPDAGKDWASNPLDHFTAAKLRQNNLEPNPPEDLARFYRRLHLDLTGLPPTSQELEEFLEVARHSPQGDGGPKISTDLVRKTARRLLATPASAEHFARHWLDAARYADTHGIHIDNYRAIWPYRDWVINAFQQGMPWDQFTIEQIAGDLMENASLEQQIATGFNRCLATTGEGGAIAEEYEAIYAQDRVDTTAAVWLGLTTGCASCHDHKFDPITTKDNYAFTAFFRNTTMGAMDRNKADHPPNVFAPLPGDRQRWAAIDGDIASAEKQIAERRKAARADFDQWLATATIEAPNEVDSTLHLHLPLVEASGPVRGTVDGQPREWPTGLPRVEGPLGHALDLSTGILDLGDVGNFKRTDPVSYGGFIRVEGKPNGAVIARMNPDNNFRGWDLWLQAGAPGAHIVDTWDTAANKSIAPNPLTTKTWQHVFVTFDGSKPAPSAMAIYVDGKPVKARLSHKSVGNNIEAKAPLLLGARHGDTNKLSDGKVALQDFRFYRRLLTPGEIDSLANNSLLRHIVSLPAEKRTKQQKAALFNYYLASVDKPSQELRARIDKLKKEQADIKSRGSVTLVMQEKKDSEPFAHILNRGLYSDKGEKVTPATPEALPPMPDDAPRNRLGLARWLVSRDNPLTARVTMNRTWYYFFGRGLVETTEDFGIMGDRPSHPKLLDWLAVEFMDSGWDYRHMIELIVTSSTYRQSANLTAEKLERDPQNILLSRGPRYRLDAEQLRDLTLAASDVLVHKLGGPPVKPYQPEGIWSAVAMPQSNTRNYKADEGDNLYRRSIYTFWKRTAPHPAMEILNAPSREVFCVRRERTNTPLQAFVTMNDPQFVEAARQLAGKAIAAAPDFDGRLDFVTTRLLSRTLADNERPAVRLTLDKALTEYRAAPDAATRLIEVGASRTPTDDPATLAAWTIIASQILNLDECLTK